MSNPDLAFKKSKKTDPFKSSISQPLRNSNFIGPECCEMEDLNGPIFKNNFMITMSAMLKATRDACSNYGYIQTQNLDISHKATCHFILRRCAILLLKEDLDGQESS
jgi:hypothetical protein